MSHRHVARPSFDKEFAYTNNTGRRISIAVALPAGSGAAASVATSSRDVVDGFFVPAAASACEFPAYRLILPLTAHPHLPSRAWPKHPPAPSACVILPVASPTLARISLRVSLQVIMSRHIHVCIHIHLLAFVDPKRCPLWPWPDYTKYADQVAEAN